MSDKPTHRANVHSVMLVAELEIAVVKLQAEREIGKAYAILYFVVEGAFKMEYLSREDHDLLIGRYSRKLVEVTKEKRTQRENSHVPVLTLEQQRDKQFWEKKDRQFKGQLEQWEAHLDPKWRRKALADAEKYKEKLESARQLLNMEKA